ncbi:MAG: HAMP domain-containing sensor histidine kinase [Bacteroidota bacterium]|nr:HAMP domain-containing sensor histidine kinase [Bacteroidota bacterium]
MRLLNYTTQYFALLLLGVITIWAVAFYYAMLDEIYDSLDDGLENQKILLLKRAQEDPSILAHNDFDKHVYSFTPISAPSFERQQERYQDTFMYMLNEEDYEPVRIYESAIQANGGYYKLKIITSMVEEDDLIEDLVSYLIGLYAFLVLCILILNNLLLKRIWKPFHYLIDQLKDFKLDRKTSLTTAPTKIEEFTLLNTTVTALIASAQRSYEEQKQFIENASHELQTPLAIVINKLELFIEQQPLSDEQLVQMASVLDNLGRLTRLNKSLLLLSKIENEQFQEEAEVDFKQLLHQSLSDFEAIAAHKNSALILVEETEMSYRMNRDLAVILVNNLIKNALVHGTPGAPIHLRLKQHALSITNQGTPTPLKVDDIFARFKKSGTNEKSTGLGLPIAQAIAVKYQLQLAYSYTDGHRFTLTFPI